MDFRFTEEQESFRQEICQFLDQEVTAEVLRETEEESRWGPHCWELLRKMGAKCWVAPSFPVEYGGLGLSRIYHFIVVEELDRRGAFTIIHGLGRVGADMVGPTLLRYGTEEQKKEYLPGIARGEIEFALGYSEPQAGSDLAALQMRAVDNGDEYIISGQKTFNTHCHFVPYHWLAARTDPDAPPHKGISMFIVDMNTPGITIEPISTLGGERTNEVFYDDVHVPKRCLIGEKNQGWYYMSSALDQERILVTGNLEKFFQKLISYAKETGVAKNPLIRQRLAQTAIEINVARLLSYRLAWLQDREIAAPSDSAIEKAFVSELQQRLAAVGMQMLGLYGQLQHSDKYAPLQGAIERFFRACVVYTIGGGSSEIMRNIIARRGLRLPG